MTDDRIKRVLYEHTKLNPNQADDQALLDAIVRAVRVLQTDDWHSSYCAEACTLCGNRGWLDTRGVKTMAGVSVGRVNYCICPNGRVMRERDCPIPGR